ncbi:MAG: 2-hydroxychromene-2-carboxylate isomerase [Rhodospirillales bacterium]|nr:2-hydroxychromene-2-carboxylate isomerase [Rhodospirillales bacterium]
MRIADWYYDVISPYAYFQTFRFDDLPEDLEIRFRPVLFAGLLKHWGTLGPAEVPPKRTYMYRYLHWLAARMGVPFRLPPVHPFNPLKALRLAIAMGGDRETTCRIFRAVWEHGDLPDDDDGWRRMCRRLSVTDADERIASEDVRSELHANGETAIAAGVFGVPTFVFEGNLFWGFDGTDFLLDVLANPGVLQDPAMVRAGSLPLGKTRNISSPR